MGVPQQVRVEPAGNPPRRPLALAIFGDPHGWLDTPVVSRARNLAAGRIGPLIVEEYDATCVVPPGARAPSATNRRQHRDYA